MRREPIFGQIPTGVGHSGKLQGEIRQLGVRDQLQQVVNLRGVTTINHPVHGTIQVDKDVANELLNSGATEAQLLRYKLRLFQQNG